MGERSRKYVVGVVVVFFILSQDLLWDILSLFHIPVSSMLDSEMYPVWQIMFSWLYIIFTVICTYDSKYFSELWKRYPMLHTMIDATTNLSINFLCSFMALFVIVHAVISPDDYHKEIKNQIEDSKNRSKEAIKFPLAVKCIFPIGVVTICSIPFFYLCQKETIYYYKQIMNLLADVVGLLFVLRDLRFPNRNATEQWNNEIIS